MFASLVRVVPFRQDQECPHRRPGIFLARLAAQPLDGLPMIRFLRLLLPLLSLFLDEGQTLKVLDNYAEADLSRHHAASDHLPTLASSFAHFFPRLVPDRFPMGDCLCQGVGAILLAAEVTKRATTDLALSVAETFDQIIASRVTRSSQNNECHNEADST